MTPLSHFLAFVAVLEIVPTIGHNRQRAHVHLKRTNPRTAQKLGRMGSWFAHSGRFSLSIGPLWEKFCPTLQPPFNRLGPTLANSSQPTARLSETLVC